MEDVVWNYMFLPLDIEDFDSTAELFGTEDQNKDLIQTCIKELNSDGDYMQIISNLSLAWTAYTSILNKLDEDHFVKTQALFKFIIRYSLQIIFDEKWMDLDSNEQSSLKENIQKCHQFLEEKLLDDAVAVSNVLKIIDEPWQSPAFNNIIDDNEAPNEIQDFYKGEEGDIFFERIRILCSSGCEDLAYKLVRKCYSLSNEYNKTILHDLRLILMVHQDNLETLTNELNQMNPEEGVNFIKRLMQYEKMSNVCKHMRNVHSKISSVLLRAIHLIMMNLMGKPEVDLNYTELCVFWVDRIFSKNKKSKLIQSLGDMSNSSAHLYILTEEIIKKFADVDLPFCIELFTRATTININEFSSTRINQEEKKKLSQNLCSRFLRLAELFHSCPGIRKECLLTAFTLYPTQELLKQIIHSFEISPDSPAQTTTVKKEALPDNEGEQLEKELNKVVEDPDDIILIQSIKPAEKPKSSILADSGNYNYLEGPNIISRDGEHLGLSKTLCDDLSILLLGSRQDNNISWGMDKKELEDACLEFMKNFETQYAEKELTYLKIDYSKFDNLPRPEVDEYCGVEKGYEIFLEEEEEEEEVKEKRKPEKPKQKKKTYDSEANDSAQFDYLYTSSENSDDSSQKNNTKRKKKRHHKHSSSDSDFKPSSEKTYKDKKFSKKISWKPKTDVENTESIKREKKIKSNYYSRPAPEFRAKPCMRPSLVPKTPIQVFPFFMKKNLEPEKRVSILRLIRKVKIHNDVNNAETLPLTQCFNPRSDKFLTASAKLDPQVFSQDKTSELTNHNFSERDKFFEYCTMKNSSISPSPLDPSVHCKDKLELLHYHNKSFEATTKPTPQLGKTKIPDDGRSEPFAQRMEIFSQSYFSNEISEYFTNLNITKNSNSTVDPDTKASN